MVNFKNIYFAYLEKFKNKIKNEYIEKIFHEEKEKRIELKRVHTKNNQDPEALTSDIIREMLRECKIDPLDISREVVIEGMSNNVFKKVKKKPDYFIESLDPNSNNLLFEIEHLNKILDRVGDGEGIEQARDWYSLKPTLFFHYDSIITNFVDWFILKCDLEKEDFTLSKIKPWEMLEIITDRKFGRGKEYIIEQNEVQKIEITNRFYNGFQERLKKLLQKPSKILIDIEVQNYKRPENLPDDEYEKKLIGYYRTIFSRLLFIKILESWKMLPLDPIKKILNGEKMHWNSDLRFLFFEVFNKKNENRPKEIPEGFKNLPYLNGGLFRPSGIEVDKIGNLRNVQLNPDAFKDIWDFFKQYKFLRETPRINSVDSNTINPEILGYIFERFIGDERKLTGSYYTPEEITTYMVENTLFSYVVDKVNKFLKPLKVKEIRKISDIDFLENSVDVFDYILREVIKDITVCDPACGSGAFLEKTAEKLLYLYKKCYKGCGRTLPYISSIENGKDSQMPFSDINSAKKFIIQNNIYGVDINPSAIEICELRLWLWVVRPPESLNGASESIDILPLPNIEYNLRCGNSLIGYHKIGSKESRRIDESTFFEIFDKKESLINDYYQKDKSMNEIGKELARSNINRIINESKDRLNKLLLSDYQKQKIIIPAQSIFVSNYINEDKFTNLMQDLIYQINKNNNLARFKIIFKHPVDINLEIIKTIEGIAISKEKKTSKIKSIYSTSKLNFGYYSEYGKNPLSKFILTLISNWEDVNLIEFDKKVSLDDLKLINPFHWFMEFSKIFNPKSEQDFGYDIIIGNPPFVRIENIDEPEREIYKRNFDLAEKRFDLFILFYEICNTLVKNQGYLCLVSSNKFLKSQTAKNMRKFIKSNFSIREILNFNNYNAFRGVNIKTLLIFLKKKKEHVVFPYISINDKNFVLSFSAMELIERNKMSEFFHDICSIYQIDDAKLEETNWEFLPHIVKNIMKKLTGKDSIKLGDLIKSNRQGVVTAANDVFIVGEDKINEFQIEPEFVHKIIKGEEIRRWVKISWDNKYLVYPYNYDSESKTRTKINISEDANLKVLKYLEKNKEKLNERYCVKSGNKDWFELHDPVSPEYFLEKKIMFPDISLVPSFSVDLTGELFGLDTNYSIIPKNENHLFYLLAILNSFILEIYYKHKFQTLSKEFRFKTFLVNEIPICDPERIDKDIFHKITTLSKNLYQNYDVNLEHELNSLIKELYQIDDREYSYILVDLKREH